MKTLHVRFAKNIVEMIVLLRLAAYNGVSAGCQPSWDVIAFP